MKGGQIKDELTARAAVVPGHRSARFWWGWGVALALSTLLVLLATLPPFVGSGLREALMHGFSTVCHQIPERSPMVQGTPLAVCHRCYGVYWGLPLAALLFLALPRWDALFNRYAGLILLAALAPTTLDWLLGILGLWPNTPISRLATGGLLGLVVGYYLARALTQVFAPKRSSLSPGS